MTRVRRIVQIVPPGSSASETRGCPPVERRPGFRWRSTRAATKATEPGLRPVVRFVGAGLR